VPHWAGFYLGADVGFAWASSSETAYGRYFSQAVASNGIFAGSYAGFNVQHGPVVFGLEGDFEAAGLRSSQAVPSVSDPPGKYMFNADTDFRASIRGRLGYAVDENLLYVTGGAVVAHWSITQIDPVSAQQQSFSSTVGGWTVGAGLEHAFTDYWIARFEYRYSDFGTLAFTPTGHPQAILQDHLRDNAARVGLTRKFD
jgi:outer membrane immunogenic protein